MSKSEVTKDKILSEREAWYPMLKWMSNIIKERIRRGRKVLVENPWTSELWDSLCMRRLIDGNFLMVKL